MRRVKRHLWSVAVVVIMAALATGSSSPTSSAGPDNWSPATSKQNYISTTAPAPQPYTSPSTGLGPGTTPSTGGGGTTPTTEQFGVPNNGVRNPK